MNAPTTTARLADVGELRERQRERERQRHERSRRPRDALDPGEQMRREPERDPAADDQEGDRAEEDPTHADDGHRPLGDDADHDGQHDEAHDVVGHRRAEHDPRLGGGERAEVTEDAGGDPDARRRQRSGDEQRGVEAVADEEHRRRARGPGRDHADGGHLQRAPARPCRARRGPSPCRPRAAAAPPRARRACAALTVAHQSEHRRSDDDPGDDLPDDRRDADPLRELGRDLRRDEHHQDVEENGDDVGGHRSQS